MAPAAQRESKAERPLSPHLQIYSPPINMTMSILHRLTGAALYFGTLLLICWLIAAATGPDELANINGWFAHPLGMLVLFGYTWALIHHMLGGIRHLIWDAGRGFDLKTVDMLCWATIIGSVVLTVALWAGVLLGKGVL